MFLLLKNKIKSEELPINITACLLVAGFIASGIFIKPLKQMYPHETQMRNVIAVTKTKDYTTLLVA